MSIPADAQYVAIPIFNQLVPGEGPKSIRAQMDFSTVDQYDFDMTNAQESGIIKAVQTLYIDTTNANEPVSFIMDGAQQVVTVLPGKQGYFPVLQRNPPQFSARSTASVGSIVVIHMLNVPMPMGVWDSVAP